MLQVACHNLSPDDVTKRLRPILAVGMELRKAIPQKISLYFTLTRSPPPLSPYVLEHLETTSFQAKKVRGENIHNVKTQAEKVP